MTYMEQLKKSSELGIYPAQLIIADQAYFLTNLDGEEFEGVCKCAEKAFLKDERNLSFGKIVKTAFYLFRKAKRDGGPLYADPLDVLAAADEGEAWYDALPEDEIKECGPLPDEYSVVDENGVEHGPYAWYPDGVINGLVNDECLDVEVYKNGECIDTFNA